MQLRISLNHPEPHVPRHPLRSAGRSGAAFFCALALGAAACAEAPDSDGGAGDAAAETSREASAPATPVAGRVPGTPPGGLEEWIADIRAGLADVPGRVGSDPTGARQTVVTLYTGRQEFIELYWGIGQRAHPPQELIDEVMEAESRFHALMTRFSEPPPPDSAAAAQAVDSILTQLDRVLETARASGVPLDPDSLEIS